MKTLAILGILFILAIAFSGCPQNPPQEPADNGIGTGNESGDNMETIDPPQKPVDTQPEIPEPTGQTISYSGNLEIYDAVDASVNRFLNS